MTLARPSRRPMTDPATRRCSLAAPGGAKLLPIVIRALDDAAVAVEDISLRRPTLDEVFLALTETARHHNEQPQRRADTRRPPKAHHKEDAA